MITEDRFKEIMREAVKDSLLDAIKAKALTIPEAVDKYSQFVSQNKL